MIARALVLSALLLSAPAYLAAQEHEHGPASGEKLGAVTFPTSCAPAVQEDFERAVAMLHSFWFPQAEATFQDVIAADPDCAMAHWGVAMTLWGNPMARTAPAEERAVRGLAAAERAVELAANATERERLWANAALALYREQESVGHLDRMLRHEEAMRLVHEADPDDAEAAIFYARAVVADAPPTDLKFERQLYAATILEPLFIERPEHPGLAHYIIHAFDAPPIAEQGLEAARRYAEIAPSAPHALHMPSHIFTRLGYWEDSIETNRRSAEAEENPNAAVHPLDYMVYAHLQLGEDDEAEAVVARTVDLPDQFYRGITGYNYSAMPARLALERSRWEDAGALELPTGAPPHVEAITRFARAIGLARTHRPAEARAEALALSALRDTLQAKNDTYWATIVEAQMMAATAWIAYAEDDVETALQLAEAAAVLEESVEKHPVTPGPLLPARELQGDLFFELDRLPEAVAAYERVLVREPRRARALYGAARAAELGEDEETAARHYEELVEVMSPESERSELMAAKSFLTVHAPNR